MQTQVALLTKYLWVGKHCYELRNFATAMQVLSALESMIVRQLPVRLRLMQIFNFGNKWSPKPLS